MYPGVVQSGFGITARRDVDSKLTCLEEGSVKRNTFES